MFILESFRNVDFIKYCKDRLQRIGVQGRLVHFIANFFNNRISSGKNSLLLTQWRMEFLKRVFPVYSASSYLLKASSKKSHPLYSLHCFADDLNIKTALSMPKTYRNSSYKTLKNGVANGLRFSPSKTKYVIFMRKRSTQPLNFYMNGTLLQLSNKAK